MGVEEIHYRTYRPGDERGIVDVLNASHDGTWGTVEDWVWKHRERPGFDPECICVAEKAGRIIGCWHAVIQDLGQGGSEVRVAFEGDTAVHPEHRGGAVVLRLYDALNDALLPKGAMIRAGLATPDLAERFYGSLFGFLRLGTPIYTKALSSQPLKAAVCQLNERLQRSGRLDPGLHLVIQFKLRDMPPFWLQAKDGRLDVADGEHERPALSISGNQAPVLSALTKRARGGNSRQLVKAVFTRKVRVRGLLTNAWTLFRLFRTLMKTREKR
jgi:predicted N-acetyltransferase YhbS